MGKARRPKPTLGTINQPQALSPPVFRVGENRMGRYLMSGLFLAFSALNALAAENPEKTAVGLGEVCDKRIGPLCKSGLDCNSEGRSMRECHGTRTGRTDNTPALSVKLKQRRCEA
jgi:hypothetical protein